MLASDKFPEPSLVGELFDHKLIAEFFSRKLKRPISVRTIQYLRDKGVIKGTFHKGILYTKDELLAAGKALAGMSRRTGKRHDKKSVPRAESA